MTHAFSDARRVPLTADQLRPFTYVRPDPGRPVACVRPPKPKPRVRDVLQVRGPSPPGAVGHAILLLCNEVCVLADGRRALWLDPAMEEADRAHLMAANARERQEVRSALTVLRAHEARQERGA